MRLSGFLLVQSLQKFVPSLCDQEPSRPGQLENSEVTSAISALDPEVSSLRLECDSDFASQVVLVRRDQNA